MKHNPFVLCAVLVSLFAAFQVFAEESDKSDAAPSEAVIRKLGAMMPEQKFKREETTVSDGKIAPKDAVIYPVSLQNADGSPLMKLFFFKEGELWAVFDEAGQVMRETK
jgi:molybdopterin converting factor small subunit